MGNIIIATSPARLPLFALQDISNLPTIRQPLVRRTKDTRSPGLQRPDVSQCSRVNRGCQTVSPMCMHLPRPSIRTLPMPWGVLRPHAKKRKAGREHSKKIKVFSSICKKLASMFRRRGASRDGELYEGVEVRREDCNTRCVATNTTHIRVAYRKHVKKSRKKEWRMAAKTWRV